MSRIDADAVIVGARVAGAASALLLARAGLRVVAVDRHDYGSDTLSTHALMRAGVMQLDRWGVLPALVEAGTPPVRRATFFYGDAPLEVPIRPGGGIDALYAPRRTVLDRVLVDAARRAGAEFRFGTPMTDLVRSGDEQVRGIVVRRADGGRAEIRAGMVISADGLRSAVARLAGAAVPRRGRHSGGVLYAHWQGLADRGYRWHFRGAITAGVMPTNDGAACVFVSAPTARYLAEWRGDAPGAYRRALEEVSPVLAAELAAARQAGPLRGFAGEPGFFRRAFGPGWALVGDAGYFKDPVTAHGMTDALIGAELLSSAVAGGTARHLADYAARREAIAGDFFEATDAIASHAWSLDALRGLHLALNAAMKAEVAAVAAFPDLGPAHAAHVAVPAAVA